jgi:hypothetical protein
VHEIEGVEPLADLNQHLDYQDQQQIMTIFDLKEKEKELPMQNALFTCMFNKLALKNL